MSRQLSLKQQKFISDYLKTGNATEAALRNYDVKDRSVARRIGSENLSKPDIRALLDSFAARSLDRVEDIARNAKDDFIRLKANMDILDRAGYRPPRKINGSRALSISVG